MGKHRLPAPRVRIVNEQNAPVHRSLLDNGLAVVLCPRAHLSQSYVAFYTGLGSRNERPELNGISHVLEHMLFRGTKSYPDATLLNLAAEEIGGFLEGATYRDHMMFATACHPSALGTAIDILAELVQTPRYRSMEVERAILREELLETLDSDGRMVDLDNIIHGMLFGDTGLGMPIEGSVAHLEKFTTRDLEAHRREFLVGTNSVVSIAGPLDVHAVLKRVKRAFGGLATGTPPMTVTPTHHGTRPQFKFVRDAASQVDLRICFDAVPVHNPMYPALVMLARVLADGLGSRMHAELVDRRGLAYALAAGLTTYADCGMFEFEVTVAPNRAAEAVAAILDFAASAHRFRYDNDELRRTRRRYRYGIEFMRDSPGDLASFYGRSTLFGIERHMEQLPHQIERLSSEALRRAAHTVFQPKGLTLAAVGELKRGEWKRVQQAVTLFTRKA